MLRVFVLALAGGVLALLAWLAAGRSEPRADFVVACDELRSIDPQRVSWQDELQVAAALFEGLTRLDPRTLQPQPAVAERWEITPDGRCLVFHLRDDALWSNGEPVRADDFRFAWLRALDPANECQYAGLLFVIAGAAEYYASRSDSDPANDRSAAHVGIEAESPPLLRVRLARPCPYFLDLTAFPTLAPVYPPLLKRWSDESGRMPRAVRHLWTRPEHIVVNGAFALERWDFKRRLLLRRNPLYWDDAHTGLDSIELLITSDAGVALMAYETSRVDLVRTLEPDVVRLLIPRAEKGERPDFHVAARFATFFFRVNCTRPPLDNPALRQALSLAIDREAICRQLIGLGDTPADTFVPRAAIPSMERRGADGRTVRYEPAAGLSAGLTRSQREQLARTRLRESGFDRIAGERPIEIAVAADSTLQLRIAEAIQGMWRDVLGVRADVRKLERAVLGARIRNLDYDLARSDWYGDYLDPSSFLEMFTTGNGQNRTGWSSAAYDEAIAAALSGEDNQARFAHFRRAERILCEEQLPIIPLYFKQGAYLLRSTFTGVSDNVLDILPIQRLRRGDAGAHP